jgi:hypothetical protein
LVVCSIADFLPAPIAAAAFGPAAERVGGVTDYDIKISSPSSRDVISRHT